LNAKTNSLLIRTPEGIVFSQRLAGPVTRFFAWIIDFLFVLGSMMLVSSLLALFSIISVGLVQAFNLIFFFVFNLGYSMFLEWHWRGQTLGKRVLRLRVVDAEGLRLQPSQIVIRNLLRMVDMLPGLYMVGGLTCLFTRRAQRLGDVAANTVVVRIPKISEPDLDNVLGGKYNSLRDHPHLEARLRQNVSSQEATVALQAVSRRDELESSARLELFRELAQHFHQKVRFPAEAVDHIPDEQFIRNVVDVLYRPRHARERQQAAAPEKILTRSS
jgi:uncharacterized RDD family membrane protein YckC